MTQRLGKSRYRTYEFPKLEVIKKWSAALMKVPSGKFTQWENDFVIKTGLSLTSGIELSEEQVFRLEQLYAKFTD